MSNISVMAFSPRNIVGCFLKKKRLTKGGSRAPQDLPRYAACNKVKKKKKQKAFNSFLQQAESVYNLLL